MGGEILIFAVAVLGIGVFIFLAYRSTVPTARPYALPTIIFGSAVGAFELITSTGVKDVWIFFLWFFLAAIVFGAHAHLIKWLHERRT